MAVTMPSSGPELDPVTLEDLAALNREMAALVRSGLPLEAGLRQVADDFRGGTGRLAERLAQETAAGKSLAEAVAAQGDSLPPLYRAVVQAGLQSGRLSSAMEGFAETAARTAALRRLAGQAAVYPILVMIVAWVMLVTVVVTVLPAYDQLELGDRFLVSPLRMSNAAAWIFAIGASMALLVLFAVWWRATAMATASPRSHRLLAWIPGSRRAATLSGNANFAEMLHLLAASGVPLTEALPLAARASGAVSLEQSATALAANLSAGQSLNTQTTALRELPPLVRTALLASNTSNGLLTGLRRAADVYRERASAWIVDMALILPIALTLGIGVLVVALYAFLMLQPYWITLQELGDWRWK